MCPTELRALVNCICELAMGTELSGLMTIFRESQLSIVEFPKESIVHVTCDAICKLGLGFGEAELGVLFLLSKELKLTQK